MEQAIEKFEQQNLDLRAKMGQMKEQINKMFELLTQGTTLNATETSQGVTSNVVAVTQGTTTYPPRFTLPYLNVHPYGMPSDWNVNTEEQPAVEGHDINSHGLDAADLCLVPDVVLPADFETPKFEKYKGSSCPRVHLAMYYRKMASYIHQDKILVHCFQDSLIGAALNWYVNLEKGRVKTWRDLTEAFLC
ncbi:hypothetical protein CR513_14323, partial [Mucuna pruriens]